MNTRFIPVARGDCNFKQVSKNRFRVLINEDEEYIELDRTKADVLTKILPLLNGKYSVAQIIKRVNKKDKIKDCSKIVKQVITNLFKWGLISKCNIDVYPRLPRKSVV